MFQVGVLSIIPTRLRPRHFFTIQVKRYAFHDRAYKRTDPILLRLDTVVNVPIFCTVQGAEMYHVPYRLIFAIAHTGDTPQSGHYQAALSRGPRFYLSNDGVAARPMRTQEYDWVARNCYLLGLLRHD